MVHYGEILKSAREAKRLTVKEASFTSKIPSETIVAFEEMDTARMPARVYARPFLERYIAFLGVSREFSSDDYLKDIFPSETLVVLPGGDRKKTISRFFVVSAFFLLLGISLISYFSYQFRFYIFPPRLVVGSPDADHIMNSTSVGVKGVVDPDSSLTLNGRPIYSDETGVFSEMVYLSSGLNALEFTAVNEVGRVSKITRYILVK